MPHKNKRHGKKKHLKKKNEEKFVQQRISKSFGHIPSVSSANTNKLEGVQLTWEYINARGIKPKERGFHSCAMVGDYLYIIGGDDRLNYFGDYFIETKEWMPLPPSQHLRHPRTGHSCTFHRNQIYVFGGRYNVKYLSDMWVFDLDKKKWKKIKTKGEKVEPRGAHTASKINDKWYIFGGLSYDENYFNTLLVYDFETKTFSIPKTKGTVPMERAGHSATVIGNSLYIFGGRIGSKLLQDVHRLNTETLEWTNLYPIGEVPDIRAGHTLNMINDRFLLLWGGTNWARCYPTVYVLDLNSRTWYSCSVTGNIPAPRSWHTSCLKDNKLYVFGGSKMGQLFNDIHVLDVTPLIEYSQNEPTRIENKYLIIGNNSSPRGFKIKIQYKDDIRHLWITGPLNYQTLLQKISEEYQHPVKIKYTDEENDKITIRGDADLQEYFNMLLKHKKTPKFEVVFQDFEPFEINETVETVGSKNIRWLKGKQLGSGAYGTVYEAFTDDGKFIAVKQIPIYKTQKHEKLKYEIELMKDLKHENIIQYLGVEKTKNHINIFLEYAPGGSLRSLALKFGGLSEKVVRLYTRQILFGLKYLHDRNVIHRDIKGANILVGEQGIIKLADFGHSKYIEKNKSTHTHTMVGTPFWMAPEITRGRAGKASDIWSLGCTIIEILTAGIPYSQSKEVCSQRGILVLLAQDKITPKIPENVSETCKDFIRKCLIRDPKKRPTVDDLLRHDFVTKKFDDPNLELVEETSSTINDCSFETFESEELQTEKGEVEEEEEEDEEEEEGEEEEEDEEEEEEKEVDDEVSEPDHEFRKSQSKVYYEDLKSLEKQLRSIDVGGITPKAVSKSKKILNLRTTKTFKSPILQRTPTTPMTPIAPILSVPPRLSFTPYQIGTHVGASTSTSSEVDQQENIRRYLEQKNIESQKRLQELKNNYYYRYRFRKQ